MDEREFQKLLEQFPVVRSRDYCANLESARHLSQSGPSGEVSEWQDAWNTEDAGEAFWGKLKSATEKKVGAAEAEKFCKAFQQAYRKLVYEDMTPDAARNIINSRTF